MVYLFLTASWSALSAVRDAMLPAERYFELLHCTCSSMYTMLILNAMGFQHPVLSVCLTSSLHYALTMAHTQKLSWSLFAVAITLGLFGRWHARRKSSAALQPVTPEMVISYFRYIVSSFVCISIFSCDFQGYPEWKRKSKTFGLTLMDFGVVSFMLNGGILGARKHTFRTRKFVHMAILGFVRLAVLSLGYPSDVTEYGTHLNFYFVYLASDLLSLALARCRPLLTSMVLAVAHETLVLGLGLSGWMFREGGREEWVGGNREGLLSIVPYSSVFLLGKHMGSVIQSKHLCARKKGMVLLVSSLCLFTVHACFSVFSPPSRRLCNIAFTSFSSAAILFPLSLLFFFPECCFPGDSWLFLCIGRDIGTPFLLANAYVLMGNVLFDWKQVRPVVAHAVNILYVHGVFVVPRLGERTGRKTRTN